MITNHTSFSCSDGDVDRWAGSQFIIGFDAKTIFSECFQTRQHNTLKKKHHHNDYKGKDNSSQEAKIGKHKLF